MCVFLLPRTKVKLFILIVSHQLDTVQSLILAKGVVHNSRSTM